MFDALINRSQDHPWLTCIVILPLCVALPSWVGLVL